MKITAYTYNAAAHCVRCAKRRFNDYGLSLYPCDKNGVPECGIDCSPIFSTDENASGYCDTCDMAYGDAEPLARVLAIDAWREPHGWTWNNWNARGFVPLAWCDLKPRALLRALRERGCYAMPAPGHAAIEDDGYNVVILMRGTREPILAIEYGSVPA